jgi:hypothetical protein
MTAEHTIDALNQQGEQIEVANLGDAELKVSAARLASSRSQSQIAAHISASIKPFFAALGVEYFPPERRLQVCALVQEFRSSPEDRQRLRKKAFRDLREYRVSGVER